MPRWGMLIDLDRCTGCDACTVACQTENKTPPGVSFAPVYRKEVGTFPSAKVQFIPTLCMHCDDAPCIKACPSRAIYRRQDGIVLVDENKCCGSRACIAACPYGAINYYAEPVAHYRTKPNLLDRLFGNTYQVGTALKCTFCAHRIDQGIYTPACVETCPTEARIFGDLDDPESRIRRVLRERNAIALRPECDTKPSVRYLP